MGSGTDVKDEGPGHGAPGKPDKPKGMLATLERLGNALPNPFWLFVIFAGIVIIASCIGSLFEMSAEDPSSGETITVESLLTTENLQRMVTDAVDNFISFARSV